ncbi:unnamed protein product [Phytophthora lilii]|uniref:Unnamed protein product n=1 Tax=Phytophthora lilii TaxID=2077276 RepID=A0A9W6UFL1_9STRA|nr:unnamed protein product [Phytophthora lilii]
MYIMCNGITKTGKACSRKAEWCSQHLSQKPVAVPVIVDKEIEIKEKNVVENIAALPTMPPNTSTEIAHIDETPIANASILEETKSVSVKNILLSSSKRRSANGTRPTAC